LLPYMAASLHTTVFVIGPLLPPPPSLVQLIPYNQTVVLEDSAVFSLAR
jgi:hypothetical protein